MTAAEIPQSHRGGAASRTQLGRYAEVIELWRRRFDTMEIADIVELPEHLVARWVANFRDVVRG